MASNFQTQNNPATCGLATLSMVLNSLELDPDKIWKGPWRWFNEDSLDCCSPSEAILNKGINFEEFLCESKCNGAKVDSFRVYKPEDGDWTFEISKFRNFVINCCKCSEKKLVLSYSRKLLDQTGDGHYSPVGGYHEESNKILILDVARFKYPPHWVSVETIVKAMAEIDPTTQKPRGYFIMSANDQHISKVLRITAPRSRWTQIASTYVFQMQSQFKIKPPKSTFEYISTSLNSINQLEIINFFTDYTKNFKILAQEHSNYINSVFEALNETPIFKIINEVQSKQLIFKESDHLRVACLFILSQNEVGFEFFESTELLKEIEDCFLLSKTSYLIRNEVDSLSSTLSIIQTTCQCLSNKKCY